MRLVVGRVGPGYDATFEPVQSHFCARAGDATIRGVPYLYQRSASNVLTRALVVEDLVEFLLRRYAMSLVTSGV